MHKTIKNTLDDATRANPAPAAKTSSRRSAAGKAMNIPRVFSREGADPFDEIEWEERKATITDDQGKVIFQQEHVEVPKSWSMLATKIVASKYFYGGLKTTFREHSVRQLVHRVARTIADWGHADGYFATARDAENFYAELCALCVNQSGAFNSPVWFNVGLHHTYKISSQSRHSFHWNSRLGNTEQTTDSYRHPQAAACFIQSVKDTMEDIMRLATAEAMLFKYGSGTGTDLSTLRSSCEKLSGGGTPSGPLSFMRVFDQVAAVIKSGGKTRRAAKMQSLKVDHPDIVEFITCKSNEEKKAWALIEQGYNGSFGGEAYNSVMFQNANLSVRLSDDFMQAVLSDGEWTTHAVTTGEPVGAHNARELLRLIAEGTHICGDPGVQYDTTINRWHTCPNSGRINASNPCSEYMFVDNSACNLASLNLMQFMAPDGSFEIERFRAAVRIFCVAQDILVDNASYPTEEIARNSHLFRPLGLGYANLGAVIMSLGLPYDSDEGRTFAAAITALMTATAYETSAQVAATRGPFAEFANNRDSMLTVIGQHRDAVEALTPLPCAAPIIAAAREGWERAFDAGTRHGYRNAQVTVLAPTGTIGFMMDCDTTGVEPDTALVKYKQLAGGGNLKMTNHSVEQALRRLGYDGGIEAILKHVDSTDTIEGAPGLKEQDLPVFDCAFKPSHGSRCLSYHAHLNMMSAIQPFLSGAISKTINMPNNATVDEIMQAYIEGWRLGLKSVAIYRDGSKRTQPISSSKSGLNAIAPGAAQGDNAPALGGRPNRSRMPATRLSITHKFEVASHDGYLTVGLYDDGKPGELFITMAKEGSTVGGIMDAFGTAISLCLQYGVPLRELVRKFSHSRFEPAGFTKNPDIPIAKSLVDYIFRWMEITFPDGHAALPGHAAAAAAASAPHEALPVGTAAQAYQGSKTSQSSNFTFVNQEDAPACDRCGHITVRNGACYRCANCGNSMGCS